MNKFGPKLKQVDKVSGSIVKVTIHIERPDKQDPGVMVETNCWTYLGTKDNWVCYSEKVGSEIVRVSPRLAPGDPALGSVKPAPEQNHFDMCNKFSKLFLLKEQFRNWLK